MADFNKKIPGQGQFDPINSTYKHIIYLAPGQKRERLDGYSKGLHLTESGDKTYVLIQFIQRIFRSGYFKSDKSSRIEYYRNNHDGLGYTDFIMVLYPTTFHLTNDLETSNNKRLIAWLTMFYKMINTGQIDAGKLSIKPERVQETDLLSLRFKRFSTDKELIDYCHWLGVKKYPKGIIDKFYLDYRENFFIKESSPATAKELASLTEKFNANR